MRQDKSCPVLDVLRAPWRWERACRAQKRSSVALARSGCRSAAFTSSMRTTGASWFPRRRFCSCGTHERAHADETLAALRTVFWRSAVTMAISIGVRSWDCDTCIYTESLTWRSPALVLSWRSSFTQTIWSGARIGKLPWDCPEGSVDP